MRNGTICDKHDAISKLADKIKDLANDVEDLAYKAKDDGINMERGLDEKRDRIKELESENEGLRDELKAAEKEIERLTELTGTISA